MVHLQRDVGLMQTNVDVLDQYALSLQKAASRIIDCRLKPCEYPAAEIATGPWDLGSAVPLIIVAAILEISFEKYPPDF